MSDKNNNTRNKSTFNSSTNNNNSNRQAINTAPDQLFGTIAVQTQPPNTAGNSPKAPTSMSPALQVMSHDDILSSFNQRAKSATPRVKLGESSKTSNAP